MPLLRRLLRHDVFRRGLGGERARVGVAVVFHTGADEERQGDEGDEFDLFRGESHENGLRLGEAAAGTSGNARVCADWLASGGADTQDARMFRRLVLPCSALLYVSSALGQTELEPVVVSARYPDATEVSPFATTTISRAQLERAPAASLDDLLRNEVPGFSLFRRSSSAVANPTAQGANLRNLGPNGAGRVLVLLDGVPQNDPFGGWVYWQRLPPTLLESVSATRGGGAGLFGNSSLGGTLHLSRRTPGIFEGSAMLGERETWEGTVRTGFKSGTVRWGATAHGFDTEGYPVLRADQRGPVDVAADSSAKLFELESSAVLPSGIETTLRASYFEEHRGNGTRLTGNSTEAWDVSAAVRGPAGDFRWEGVVFYQDRWFESQFSSVDETRQTETPSLDQYAVPADSVGFSLTGTWRGGLPLPGADEETSKLLAGLDGRWVQGETRERFRYVENTFLNRRVAGGQQYLLGGFAEQTWQLSPRLTLTLNGRLDYWQLSDGRREEQVIASGASLRDESFDDRDGVVGNGRAGLVWEAVRGVELRLAGYTGYRVPTLNELYRPFRVRNDLTDANPALEPEQLLGAEAGVAWKPVEAFQLSATGFLNRLNDAVGNVTVFQGPGLAPDGTNLPDGGVYRQRQNVEAVTSLGVELEARWQVAPWLRLAAAYQWTDTELHAEQPELDGKTLAQSPAHVVTGSVLWEPHAKWQGLLQARYVSGQYEDDLNSLELAPYAVWDAAVSYAVTEECQVSVMVENLFDRTIETGKTGDGLVSIGAPRLASVRVRWQF